MLKKILIAVLFFAGVAFPQVTEEEHQLVKNTLVEMTIRWNAVLEANETLNQIGNSLVTDLKAIKEPSEELIAVLKKYGLYEVNNGDIPGKD